ncbi:META domain-containing protein [Photobacterium lipolyticum]|uniref:Heat-shock protein HslJ n=1 Tax=Photobacterium lipolyticum TaxID=266810 RepID=A0A2T3N088_9GAMM|nr:META domain-containing protein [Photobacterium lipolyticum]PSW05672.1 heat-shock protein HslJ [Photobacterium lipolyticum]
MKKRLLTVLALPMILAACAGSNGESSKVATEGDLVNNNWVLTQVDNKAIELPEPFKAPNLELTTDMSANGHSGCNRYFGQAELNDGQLRIEKMGMTMMACPAPAMEMEKNLTQTLTNWSEAKISGSVLTLTNTNHTLTFKRTDAQ